MEMLLEFRKQVFLNLGILGMCFHIYVFQLKFTLGGSHMDQWEIENGINRESQTLQPISDNNPPTEQVLFGDSEVIKTNEPMELHNEVDFKNRYSFKSTGMKSLRTLSKLP